MPAIVLAILVFLSRLALGIPKMWWVIKLAVVVAAAAVGLSMAGQGALCLKQESAKSWGLGVATTGISGLATVVIFVALMVYAVLLSWK